MLYVDPEVMRGLRGAKTREEVYPYLQSAIELEHATIPPYLTAMFTLKDGSNDEIRSLIRSIVIEEMLHMTIAANVMIAIGGKPSINTEKFVPKYPGPLPMAIGGTDFTVPIKRFSLDLVHDIFMTIERPVHEVPVEVPDFGLESFEKIGEFYAALQAKLAELGDGIFTVGSDQQVLTGFDPARLFAITNVQTANDALEIIVTEGEGSSTSPFESPGDPAHFYKFGEVFHGHEIVENADGTYAYSGAAVPFDATGVYPMPDNPTIDSFPAGSQARVAVKQFAAIYNTLLNSLHDAFNGSPASINAAIGLMYSLRLQAIKTLETAAPSGIAGLSYEYLPPQELSTVTL